MVFNVVQSPLVHHIQIMQGVNFLFLKYVRLRYRSYEAGCGPLNFPCLFSAFAMSKEVSFWPA